MLSELTEAMIVNGVVLATVLATDLGPARKISKIRCLAQSMECFMDSGRLVEEAGLAPL